MTHGKKIVRLGSGGAMALSTKKPPVVGGKGTQMDQMSTAASLSRWSGFLSA